MAGSDSRFKYPVKGECFWVCTCWLTPFVKTHKLYLFHWKFEQLIYVVETLKSIMSFSKSLFGNQACSTCIL